MKDRKMPLFLRLDPPAMCSMCKVQSLDESSLKINPQAFGTNPYVAIPPIPDISHKLLLSKQSVVEITRFKSTENFAGEKILEVEFIYRQSSPFMVLSQHSFSIQQGIYLLKICDIFLNSTFVCQIMLCYKKYLF